MAPIVIAPAAGTDLGAPRLGHQLQTGATFNGMVGSMITLHLSVLSRDGALLCMGLGRRLGTAAAGAAAVGGGAATAAVAEDPPDTAISCLVAAATQWCLTPSVPGVCRRNRPSPLPLRPGPVSAPAAAADGYSACSLVAP